MLLHLLFFGLILSQLYLAVLVFIKNKRAKENKLFVIVTFWLLIFLISKYLENIKTLGETRVFFLRLDFASASILGYFWLIFCYNFLEEKKIKTFINRVLYFGALILSISVYGDLIITNIDISSEAIQFDNGIFFPIYAIVVVLFYFVGLGYLFTKYRIFSGKKRIQTLYVLVGFFLSSAIISIANLFFSNRFSLHGMRIVDSSFIFFIIFTGLAIIKHKLFDIRKIVQRGVIYFISLSLVISIFLILMILLNFVFGSRSYTSSLVSGILTIILGIYGVPYIEKYFQKITDKIFYKDKYNFEKAVYEISEELNREVELEKLLKRTIDTIVRIIKIENLKFYLIAQDLVMDNEGKIRKPKEKIPENIVEIILNSNNPILLKNNIDELVFEYGKKTVKQIKYFYDKYDIEASLAIINEKKIIALIAMGQKKSGDIYTDDDILLFKTISHNIGIAIEKAILFERVKNYSKDLEAKVEERTFELKDAQKEQNNLILQISHSLQTPLTILKGELGLLKINNKLVSFDRFEKPLNDLSKYIYDLLSLSRLESVHMELKIEKINLSMLLYDLSEYFQVIVKEKNIELRNFIVPDLFINGQIDLIETMITNFVSNAVKYIGNGKNKKIDIKLEKQGKKAIVIIEDNGVGIDENSLKHLFEKFYREKTDLKTKGTGLGMAISKKIIDIHGGKIKVESSKNKGTKIKIYLKSL